MNPLAIISCANERPATAAEAGAASAAGIQASAIRSGARGRVMADSPVSRVCCVRALLECRARAGRFGSQGFFP